MGKLIVIEGLDGCGKTTQVSLLPDRLAAAGIDSRLIQFPDYEDPSSTLVRMYLGGEFGDDPDAVNAYASSLFYAVDRYASFKRHWEKYYTDGGTVICGRYVESNAYHQMAKLPQGSWDEYLDWLYETEYKRTRIPKPDLVIFLDMPVEVSEALLSVRYKGDETKKDIHEKNDGYMKRCRLAAKYAADRLGWKIVSCAKDGKVRTIEDISDEIFGMVKNAVDRG